MINFFKINNILEGPFLIQLGVPQGCTGSPLNYNIYSKDAYKRINPNCQILQFADDTVLFCSHASLNDALHFIQDSI